MAQGGDASAQQQAVAPPAASAVTRPQPPLAERRQSRAPPRTCSRSRLCFASSGVGSAWLIGSTKGLTRAIAAPPASSCLPCVVCAGDHPGCGALHLARATQGQQAASSVNCEGPCVACSGVVAAAGTTAQSRSAGECELRQWPRPYTAAVCRQPGSVAWPAGKWLLRRRVRL